MRIFLLLAILIAIMASTVLPCVAVTQQEDPLTGALVRLYVIRRDGDTWRNFTIEASGFFIDQQGTVLTDGVMGDFGGPDYAVIAVRNGELFGAALVCAPVPSHIPWPARDEELKKKVAVFKLKELDSPHVDAWVSHPANERPVTIARTHRGKLPTFPFLTIGDDPKEGDRARIAGYGGLNQLLRGKVVPEAWNADGRVTRVFKGADGLPVFEADFGSGSEDWEHGAVIVQIDGRVAGLSVWTRSGPPRAAVAISASALRDPCHP